MSSMSYRSFRRGNGATLAGGLSPAARASVAPRAAGRCAVAGAMIAAVCLATPPPAAAQPPAPPAAVDPLVRQIRALVAAGDADAYVRLLAPGADVEAARAFAGEELEPGATAAAVRARLLVPAGTAEGEAYDLTLEVLTERGRRGRLATWQLGVVRAPEDAPGLGWRIAHQDRTGAVEGLYDLTLNRQARFDAAGLTIAAEDLTLRMTRGSVYPAETDRGVAGLVLIGQGRMRFAPRPEAERGQLRIFAGAEELEAAFGAAFVRVNPETFASSPSFRALVDAEAGDADDFDAAEAVFRAFAPLSFVVDLGDLSPRAWSLAPGAGDFLAEIRTERHGTLTYVRAPNRPEDVALFDRANRRTIAQYTSEPMRAVRGSDYSDDDTVPYDVLDYRIEASFEPRGVRQDSLRARPRLVGCWIEGTTHLALRLTAPTVVRLSLRIADDLEVHSVTSPELGPLLFYRMAGQNNLVIGLPDSAPAGTELTLTVRYSGLLAGQEPDENWLGRQRQWLTGGGAPFGVAAPRYIYSNASYWYPQSLVSDYATATMALTVPAGYGVVASGEPREGNAPLWPGAEGTGPRRYAFVTLQPARYLSCIVARFARHATAPREVALPEVPGSAAVREGVSYDSLVLAVASTERARSRAPEVGETAADILRFYAALVGDIPYPTVTVALTDALLPGGHSPAYVAALSEPLPRQGGSIVSWGGDPVAFAGYPSFFLAHELAHQWWGQAVGWKNYHAQWLSEGLAQYFAALYAEREGGPDAFRDVLSQMRRWSLRQTGQGPISLGRRLGAIRDEPRVFRALVYNKSAMVLHMLRGLLGDDAFFRGLRRYYNAMRFRKAGTDDLRRAFEAEAGRSLERFFTRWIHESDLPSIGLSYGSEPVAGRGDGGAIVLRLEQRGKLFELPVTVTLRYRTGPDDTVLVRVADRVTEVRVATAGRRLRSVVANAGHDALVEID